MQAIGVSLYQQALKTLRFKSVVLYAFASTLFVSAMLLFSVQPMFAKMVVPQLGGSPSVWAVAMCFFQAVLLLGYCYAHVLTKFLGARMAIISHLVVCASAFVFLPIGLAPGWDTPPGENTQIWLLGLFAVSVGWPFFAVSANAPLLQAWFARTGHPHASDPYFLYGASNIGSMAALLGYPVLIEPLIGLAGQANTWATGFTILSVMIALSGLLLLANQTTQSETQARDAAPAAASRPSWSQRAIWIALAFVPSGLLVAFTTHITTDVASAPFLWIGPLALYLLTYILVFRDPPKPSMQLLLKLQPVFVGAVLISLTSTGLLVWVAGAVAGTGAFFTTAMICHRTLYERRPDVAYLTEFYLWMSLGGVLGGIFTALLAPVLFSIVIEYPLLLLLGLLCRKDALESSMIRSIFARPALFAGIAFAAFAACQLLGAVTTSAGADPVRASAVAFVAACAAATLLVGERLIPLVASVLAVILLLPSSGEPDHVERSFFGVHRVKTKDTDDGRFRLLSHGTTVHGAQRIAGANLSASALPVPAAYYHPKGPMARMAATARANITPGSAFRAGVVGLGAGAFACHALKGEDWRFYEIDPAVVDIAQNPDYFTFMSSCQPGEQVIIGDARLTVAREPDRRFDYLLIDAFSSDTIPVHLMTVEAIRLFLSKVSDDGLLVLHISNRYLDLEPVLEAAVAEIGGSVAGVSIFDGTRIGEYDALPSHIVVIARSKQALANIGTWDYNRAFSKPTTAAWTDDYSNVVSALIREISVKD